MSRKWMWLGLLLMLPTLGLYRFWLTTAKRRFYWQNTLIGGDRLEYTGSPLQLLIGFLFALGVFLPIYLVFFYLSFQSSTIAGVGYGAPAAVGAALANKKRGRLSVTIQGDGDFLYAPGVWWTAAHHRIPLLAVMHNNRAYHQEVMHLQRMANRHNRGITRAHIGTTIEDPNVDFAKIAQGMGVHAQGPITNPKDLAPAITRALEVVKRGEPSLIDVVTQPR